MQKSTVLRLMFFGLVALIIISRFEMIYETGKNKVAIKELKEVAVEYRLFKVDYAMQSMKNGKYLGSLSNYILPLLREAYEYGAARDDIVERINDLKKWFSESNDPYAVQTRNQNWFSAYYFTNFEYSLN